LLATKNKKSKDDFNGKTRNLGKVLKYKPTTKDRISHTLRKLNFSHLKSAIHVKETKN
jgi:hypothetical protein